MTKRTLGFEEVEIMKSCIEETLPLIQTIMVEGQKVFRR
jgi:hypothetical protein